MEATPFSVEDHIIIISWRHHHHVYLIDKTQKLPRDQRGTVLPVTETTLSDQGVESTYYIQSKTTFSYDIIPRLRTVYYFNK